MHDKSQPTFSGFRNSAPGDPRTDHDLAMLDVCQMIGLPVSKTEIPGKTASAIRSKLSALRRRQDAA